MLRTLFGIVALAGLGGPGLARAAEGLELRHGDRVVLAGNALIEREQRHGHWEAALTRCYPDRDVTFRNLGWSGDTVWGEARAGFDTPREGYQRLVRHVLALQPTVILLGYGTNEAFAGPAGLDKFRQQYQRLLDDLAPAKARVVLLTPLPMEDLGRPLPDPTAANGNLRLYAAAVRQLARQRGLPVVDFFELLAANAPARPLTDNGLHLTASGYRHTAPLLLQGLGLPRPPDRAGEDRLREKVIEKNQQYFHRWRPQNETYLFGFRKHEQGRNAKEIPEFDPYVEKLEAEIAVLRKK